MSEENGLPPGWARSPLGDLVDILDSRRIPLNAKQRAARPGPYPYYGANGQVGTLDDFLFDGDYALIAEDGGHFDEPARGVAYRATGKFWVNNHAHIIGPLGGMETPFLVHQFNSINWMPFVGGTTRLKLTQGDMKTVPLGIPPLNEQRRIVAKIDALQARSRRARQALDAVPALLDRFRQSVLAAAFRGDLTADWRAKHPDVEPASVLLDRIRPPPRPRRFKTRSTATQMGQHGLSVGDPGGTTPAGWRWTLLLDIAELGTGHTPSRRHPEYWGGQIPWVSIPDARDHHGRVIHTTRNTITKEGLDNSAARVLPAGSVFLCRTAASIGYSTILGRDMATSQDMVSWTCTGALEPAFLMWLLIAEKQSLLSFGEGSAHRTVYFPEILSFHVCLPPVQEQREIVARVETQLGFAATVADQAGLAEGHMSRLNQSILAKAFRGELVPQDPNDEPAAVLLERIKAERAAAPPQKGRGRRKRT